jgi:predicted RND superfamily exporter protein
MTTMVGFASLLVARHRGVYSVGLLLLLAVGSVFAASFTVLPALLRLLDREIPKPAETVRENREPVIERRRAVGE